MGGFVSIVSSVVYSIGKIFCNVARWLDNFIYSINHITENFICDREYEIRRRDNPRAVGKYLACKKESKEVDKKAEEIGKELSDSDREWAEKQCEDL